MDHLPDDGADASRAPAAEVPAAVARTRARVVAAARAQVAAGDTQVAMNALARRAGVGVGTVYRHFPTQQSLLEAVAADGLGDLVQQARAAAREPDPVEGLHRLVAVGLQHQLRDAGVAAVLASSDLVSGETSRLTEELWACATSVLERAGRAGVVRPGVTADDVRRLVCGVRYAVEAGERHEGDAELYLAVLLAGLGVPAAVRTP